MQICMVYEPHGFYIKMQLLQQCFRSITLYIPQLYGHTWMHSHTLVHDHTWVIGQTWVHGHTWVNGHIWVRGHSWVHGHPRQTVEFTNYFIYTVDISLIISQLKFIIVLYVISYLYSIHTIVLSVIINQLEYIIILHVSFSQ